MRTIGQPGHEGPGTVRSAAPWWMYALAASFLGYFSLLVFSDLTRPEFHGLILGFHRGEVVVSSVVPGSPAAGAALRSGDRLTRASGRSIRNRLDWEIADVNLRAGEPFFLEVERDGSRRTVSLLLDRASPRFWTTRPGVTLLAARSVQLITLLLACLVGFGRPVDRGARVGGWLLASIGVYSVTWPYGVAAHWRGLPDLAGLALWAPYLSSLAIPAILFTFFAVFPRTAIPLGRWWWVAWLPMAAVVLIEAPMAFAAVYRPREASPLPDRTALAGLVTWAYVVAALGALALGYRRSRDLTERRRLRVITVGSVVGLLGMMPVTFSYRHAGATPGESVFSSAGAALGTVVALALPASFAYAILRHRLFDVRVMVRRGLRYAMARGVLASLVPLAGTVFAVDIWMHRDVPVAFILVSRGWMYAALAGMAILARANRKRWLEALDRRFFRERYSAQRLLGQVIEEIAHAPDRSSAAIRVLSRVDAALHPETACWLERDPGAGRYVVGAASGTEARASSWPPGSKIAELLRWTQRPVHVSTLVRSGLGSGLLPEDLDWLGSVRAELLVPVLVGSDLEGVFVLGPKRSEEPYPTEDEELLLAVARSLALRPARVAPDERASHAFGECPACGGCYDWGADRCPQDGVRLDLTPLPRVLNDRYRLARRIGRGGMGTVYEAADTALGRQVAVKVVREEVGDGTRGAERFVFEARAAATIAHPNVVTVHDIGRTPGGRPFFVMELLVGCTLRDELDRIGPLPRQRVREVLRGVCDAVEHAHARRLIHRDLKPENVFLCRDGTPKVLDFGLAQALDPDGRQALTATSQLVGTLPYMAPERFRGGVASPAWDIWALAVIAFEMVTGVRPFTGGPDASSRLEILPPALVPFFRNALSPNPDDRPASAARLFGEIAPLLA